MELHYFRHAVPGSPFYEAGHEGGVGGYRQVEGPWPEDWWTRQDAEWLFAAPRSATMPDQGWKVHVSATLGNSQQVLDVVVPWCVAHEVPFKFIRTPVVLLQRNSKYGDRGASGKFVTVYPRDEAELEKVVRGLDDLLAGSEGPYILSDLRWRQGPVYVRYGAFVHRLGPDAQGRMVPCIEDPEGNLVPDERRPAFRPPAWAPVPAFLEPAVQARASGTLADFPYRVTAALHHSNGGGVYLAEDTRTGATVVLKEARPFAGLDEAGADAVARLETERTALERLAGVPGVPALLDYRRGHEHYFLVREHVRGESLNRLLAENNPLLTGSTDPGARAAWARWADAVLAQAEATLGAMHERGLVFGDVHPNNVIVDADGTVGFIDFESVTEVADALPQTLGAPGYRAPAGTVGAAVDRYGLACLRLGAFVPATITVPWGGAKARMLRDRAVAEFGLPDGFGDGALAVLEGAPHPALPVEAALEGDFGDRGTWRAVRGVLHRGLLGAEVTGPGDRVFPGDVQQFLVPGGGTMLATGTAGVLWASVVGGLAVPESLAGAVAERVGDALPLAAGLWDGWAGVGVALRRAGDEVAADEALRRALAARDVAQGPGYFRGAAGVALACTESGDEDLRRAAETIADELASFRRGEVAAAARTPGLMYGASGPAVLELVLHDLDGAGFRLDRAREYLRADHATLGPLSRTGAPWFQPPPLVAGGLSVALAAREFLVRAEDEEVRRILHEGLDTPRARVLDQPGLLRGHAGVILGLTALRGAARDLEDELAAHLRALPLFVGSHAGGAALLGDHGLRLSTDLTTGTAGVIHAVDVAHGLRRDVLPFLSPVAR